MSRILVIEDEEDVAKVLRKRLSDAKFDVIWAQDAYTGVKLAHDESPDLIILDLMLPAGGGLKTLKNIRLSQKNAFVPVIVLTGMKDEAYKKQILDEGVDAFLEKPYNFYELLGIINKILEEKKGKA